MKIRVLTFALLVATLVLWRGLASATELANPPPRIAVVLHPQSHFVAPPTWQPNVAQKALEAGVTEACVDENSAEPIRPKPKCDERVIDMPSTDVCYVPTLSDILNSRSSCENQVYPELVKVDPAICDSGTCNSEALGAAFFLLIVDASWSYEYNVMSLSAQLFNRQTGETRKVSPTEFEPKMQNGSPIYHRFGLVPLEILKWFSREVAIKLIQGKSVGTGPSDQIAAANVAGTRAAMQTSGSRAVPTGVTNDDSSHRWLGWTVSVKIVVAKIDKFHLGFVAGFPEANRAARSPG